MVGTMAASRPAAPVRVGDLLTAAVPGLSAHLLAETIRRQWPLTVGPEMARRSRPRGLRMGVLEVAVDNSPWLHEMTLRSAELLAAIRSRHGHAVTALRFSLGDTAGPAPAGGRPGPGGRAERA